MKEVNVCSGGYLGGQTGKVGVRLKSSAGRLQCTLRACCLTCLSPSLLFLTCFCVPACRLQKPVWLNGEVIKSLETLAAKQKLQVSNMA